MTKASRVKLPKEPTRKQQSRAEQEATKQRRLFIGLAAVLVVAVGLVLLGIVDERILKPSQPVAQVNDEAITTGDFQKRVRYQQLEIVIRLNQLQQQRTQVQDDPSLSFFVDQIDQQASQLESLLFSPQELGKQVLDGMLEAALIRHEAAGRGISVSPEEVTTYIEQNYFNYYRVPPTPAPTRTPLPAPSLPITQTPVPTLTPLPSPTPKSAATFKEEYSNYLKVLSEQAGISESDFRRMREDELLRQKLYDAFAAGVPPQAEQIKLRYITFQSDTAAQVAAALLAGGQAFEQYYAQVKSGQVVSATTGEMDWMLPESLDQSFGTATAEKIRALSSGQASGVLTTTYGIQLAVQVTGREPQPLTDAQKQSKQQQLFDEWLEAQLSNPSVVNYLNDRYLDVVPEYSQ